MTFILTVVSEGPPRFIPERVGPFILESVLRDDAAADRAGFIPSLRRYLGRPLRGSAVHVVLEDEPGGYRSSNALFEYGAEDEAAKLCVADDLRGAFEDAVNACLAASAERRIVIVVEDNGHVTDPDLTLEEASTIDVLGPMDAAAFWRLVDLKEVSEDSVIIVEAS
ncbi:MAG TPA: hypothetical protein VFS39_04370 [Nitrospira sp.]|nr:hypothetical protein [Nitrospira sp.]